jgi:hypothetical protein
MLSGLAEHKADGSLSRKAATHPTKEGIEIYANATNIGSQLNNIFGGKNCGTLSYPMLDCRGDGINVIDHFRYLSPHIDRCHAVRTSLASKQLICPRYVLISGSN